MGNDDFNGQALTEKLTKLNSSQQSIELLSRWCVSYRKKAKQIVETWDKLFKSAQWDQRVAFLFLANDILQISRRKGSEFVNEFWKVLPDVLKDAHENGGDRGKEVVARLVNIWEERKVFGSRGQNLKDLLGKDSPLPLSSGKSLNPIKIVKKDAHSLRIKLSVGAMPEKIISAFHLVHDEDSNEEIVIDKFEGAIYHVEEIEKDVGKFSGQGGLQCSELIDKIKEQEDVLGKSISQLENAEAIRAVLVSHLKEALADQESKLENIRNKLQVARGSNEHTTNLRQRLTLSSLQALPVNSQQMEAKKVESTVHTTQLTNISLGPSNLPVAPLASPKVNEEDSKKAAAAAVAAKLAASTSSAQMLTSILSSLVAEEEASMSSGLKPPGFSTLPFAPPEKRPRLDNNPETSNSSYFVNAPQPVTSMPLGPPLGGQSISQTTQTQAPFLPPPPPPPPPIGNTPPSQSVQSSGMMMGMMPYTYSTGNLPPLSLPGHTTMGLARPAAQTQPSQLQIQQMQSPQSMQQQQQQQQQQQSGTGGYYRPPGIGFYGQGHQTAPQPAPRQ